ncbi:unnamed protein product [Medioppia subpectinata]|uniref:Carbohydrate sulfotransferase n=1 Tax=Medioppia subpectinata TaxID=1979941 RepID=A0A7R9KK37_9ACAR|nr:unnamed protein product [Medioppia subpectinata]CAG2103740.1 unnamed protein product [Medioppia subpectinata]
MSLNAITCLSVLAAVLQVIAGDCKVTSNTYSSNDGLVVAKVAHIIQFTAQCDGKPKGLPLYADINGQALPAIRSDDVSTGQTSYQISWTVDLAIASSGSHSIAIYDEEGFGSLRKAQRAGDGSQSQVKPLFTLELSHSSPYRGPLLPTELVATVAALGLWWAAYRAKNERSLRERRERRLLELIQAQDNQQRRQTYVRNVCYHQYGWRPLNDTQYESLVDTIGAYLDHLIVDDTNQLIYCFVPKVASTNWKRVLLAVSGVRSASDPPVDPLYIKGNESHVPHAFRTLSQYNTSAEIAHRLRTYLKFMFARHPYERLLSAYRNKLERTYSDYFRNRFGRKIVRQYRPTATNESLDRGHDVTFAEFLSYVSQLNHTDHKREFNEHWRPVFDLCLPCAIDYDVIGKYETLHSDVQLVLRRAGIGHLIQFPTRSDTYSNQPSSDLLNQYYNNISDRLLDKIADVYHEDLQLFQYDKVINLKPN